MDATYDGNILAGPLAEVFTAEITTAVAWCASCGRSSAVAQLAVYGPDPGLVARCPGCAEPMLRLVRTPEAIWVDLSGTGALQVRAGTDE